MYAVVLVWTSNRGRQLSSAEKHMVVLDDIVMLCASQGCSLGGGEGRVRIRGIWANQALLGAQHQFIGDWR